jgi:hypothetical protein
VEDLETKVQEAPLEAQEYRDLEPPQTPLDSTSEPVSEPEFEPLMDAEAESEPDPAKPPEPEPFTGEEIANGVAFAVIWGMRLTPEQVVAFQRAFAAALPIMPTPAVLDMLGVGEALAAYGIHKGMLGGPDALESLPVWLRLLLGVGYLGLAVFMGIRAAKEVSGEAKTDSPAGSAVAGAGAGKENDDAGPFKATPAAAAV